MYHLISCADSEIGTNFDGWSDPDFQSVNVFYWFWLEMGVLVHPNLEILWPASLPFVASFFFLLMSLLRQNQSSCDFSMVFLQNYFNLLLTRWTINKTSILEPIKFWWVPQMPEMVVPKSSHDRFCLKKSSPKPRSTITISESEFPRTAFVTNSIGIEDKRMNQISTPKKQWKFCRGSISTPCHYRNVFAHIALPCMSCLLSRLRNRGQFLWLIWPWFPDFSNLL